MSPDQKGIETGSFRFNQVPDRFTMSPDQKGIETDPSSTLNRKERVHNEPRSKGD